MIHCYQHYIQNKNIIVKNHHHLEHLHCDDQNYIIRAAETPHMTPAHLNRKPPNSDIMNTDAASRETEAVTT